MSNKDLEMLERYIGKKPRKKRGKLKVYRVVLTEKYETMVVATSKEHAKSVVEEFGGSDSFYRSETVYLTEHDPEGRDVGYYE